MKYIVPVVSGKGGVGKSTVAVNLAVALSVLGKNVALVDCDFYGPSIPTMLGGGEVVADHEGKIIPPVKFGLKYISIGFFLPNADDPVIWRGPMFNKALGQLFEDVKWGDTEIFVVDMPPGTGDAQLSLCQMFDVSGALVVTTPQEVALADVRKVMNMLKKVDVDTLGVVENMSGFIGDDGKRYDIFGKGGGEHLARDFGVPLLSVIPIDFGIREGGDKGLPAVCAGTAAATVFQDLANKLIEILENRPKPPASLKIVS